MHSRPNSLVVMANTNPQQVNIFVIHLKTFSIKLNSNKFHSKIYTLYNATTPIWLLILTSTPTTGTLKFTFIEAVLQ